MNLVIPIASTSRFFSHQEYGYPYPLIEINGKPIIQHVTENLALGNEFNKVIFIVKQDDCDNFHLDNTLNLLCSADTEVIKLPAATKGALCSVLLAIDHINNSEPLIIANADQIIDGGISRQINQFIKSKNLDAACISFDSVHPRWSYIRVNDDDLVIETAEKRPLSRNAIAGVYMYKRGLDFVEFGMKSIKNGSSIDGKFYISPVFNEYVLANKTVGHFRVENSSYHSFYNPQKIAEFENLKTRG